MSERVYIKCKACAAEVLLAKSFTAGPDWQEGVFEFWRGVTGVDQRDKISAFVSDHSRCMRNNQVTVEWD